MSGSTRHRDRHDALYVAGLLFICECCLLPAIASSQVAPGVLKLIQIKKRMAQRLERLPDLACSQIVDRVRFDPKGRLKKTDTFRLEGMIDGEEAFSWPAQGRTAEREPPELWALGTISGSLMISAAKAIFAQDAARIRFAGEEHVNGRSTLRYDYRVPLRDNGFQLSVAGQDLRLPYSGSFWADAEELDLVRLTRRAEDIPAKHRIAEAVQSVEYRPVRIDDETLLLPQSADEALRYWSGDVSLNRTEFSQWRRYLGISALSLASPGQEQQVSRARDQAETLISEGAELVAVLETPIDSATARIGDPIQASLSSRSQAPGTAVLNGRIRWLEKQQKSCVLGIEFSKVTWEGKRANFVVDLIDVRDPTGLVGRHIARDWRVTIESTSRRAVDLYGELLNHLRSVKPYEFRDIPGVALLTVQANPFRLAPGLELSWKTK